MSLGYLSITLEGGGMSRVIDGIIFRGVLYSEDEDNVALRCEPFYVLHRFRLMAIWTIAYCAKYIFLSLYIEALKLGKKKIAVCYI